MRVTKATTRAASRFYRLLTDEPERPPVSERGRRIYDHIEAAFLLYQLSWGPKWNISEWQWPFDTLQDHFQDGSNPAVAFSGSQPWTVLLREAVKLAAATEAS